MKYCDICENDYVLLDDKLFPCLGPQNCPRELFYCYECNVDKRFVKCNC